MKASSTKTFVVTPSSNHGVEVSPDTHRIKKEMNSADIALIREYVKYAIESINDVITHEETYRDGNRSPILGTLKQYARDGKALLERLEA